MKSVRGPGGGYRLALPAAQTAVSDIIRAVDEPLHATRCGSTRGHVGCMASGEQCLTHGLWDALGHVIEDYLASVSLEDVTERRFHPQPAAAAVAAAAG